MRKIILSITSHHCLSTRLDGFIIVCVCHQIGFPVSNQASHIDKSMDHTTNPVLECVHVYNVCIPMHMYMFVHVYTYVRVWTYVCACMRMYVCLCILCRLGNVVEGMFLKLGLPRPGLTQEQTDHKSTRRAVFLVSVCTWKNTSRAVVYHFGQLFCCPRIIQCTTCYDRCLCMFVYSEFSLIRHHFIHQTF